MAFQQSAGKRTKESVDYSIGDEDRYCGICQHFDGDVNRCELVAGKIRWGGWCRLFSRKGADSEKEDDDGDAKTAE